jgi:hypothetical protein
MESKEEGPEAPEIAPEPVRDCCASCASLREEMEGVKRQLNTLTEKYNTHRHSFDGVGGPMSNYAITPVA